MTRGLLLLVVLALLGGCGVPAEDLPEPVPTAGIHDTESPDDDPADGTGMTVYLVRGADLLPVMRATAVKTTGQALELLVEGPTRAEAADGVRTALPPEVVGVQRRPNEGIATVAVTRGFTGITGGNQLLAVAQIVWTLTELPTVTGVRFTVEGAPVEVPTDEGLTARPVDRDDYGSVAPDPPPAPTGSDTPAAETPAADTPAGDTAAGGTPTPR